MKFYNSNDEGKVRIRFSTTASKVIFTMNQQTKPLLITILKYKKVHSKNN